MIKKIAVAAACFIAGVLLYAATKPGTLHVERSTVIQAPPGAIHPLVNDFHTWRSWSPYEKRDPALQRNYSGAAAGRGAVYEWNGNNEVGQGRMEITESALSRIAIKLDFDMDDMIGSDFETGLANLKSVAEAKASGPDGSK